MASVMSTRDGSSLAGVVELILDKGIVIDAWVEVSLIGIPILSVKGKVVISSVDTYLRYAEALGLTTTSASPPVMLPATARWLPPTSAPRVLPAATEGADQRSETPAAAPATAVIAGLKRGDS
jgi:gas vesicle structural protein